MAGTLAGALEGRRIALDPETFRSRVTAEMTGTDYFARVKSIAVDYALTVPPDQVAATERALRAHTRACRAHKLFAHRISITWRARVQAGDQAILLHEPSPDTALPHIPDAAG